MGEIADDQPTSVGAAGDPTTAVPPPTQAASAGAELAWSIEEPATLPLRQSWRLTWGRAAVLLACACAVALAIGFGGWAIVPTHDDGAALRLEANPPPSWAAPPPSWMPTTQTPARAQATSAALPGTDERGWTAYPNARCDSGNRPAVMGRTAFSVVVVCQIQPGDFYYRGVRLSDGAGIELAHAVRSSAGFDVTNPSDGTVYRIRSTGLSIAPPDGPASSEPMLEYASD